jgi:hypothetical protein
MPTQEQFKNSPTYPVIVTPNPMATKQVRFRLLMFVSAHACKQHAWTQPAVACAAAATSNQSCCNVCADIRGCSSLYTFLNHPNVTCIVLTLLVLPLLSLLQALDGTADPQYAVPINQGPVTINAAFFEGIMEIHLKGLPNSQKAVFDGKKRHFQIMCQVGTGKHSSCTTAAAYSSAACRVGCMLNSM